jgi:hypothetical protein
VININDALEINYPTIGDRIGSFISSFGEPLPEKEGSILNRFDLNIEGSSYLMTVKSENDEVHNISFSKPVDDKTQEIGVRLFAEHMLPIHIDLVKKIENKIIPELRSDTPVSIFEYYSESVKDCNGYINNEHDRGYITLYFAVEEGRADFTISLSREEVIQ